MATRLMVYMQRALGEGGGVGNQLDPGFSAALFMSTP